MRCRRARLVLWVVVLSSLLLLSTPAHAEVNEEIRQGVEDAAETAGLSAWQEVLDALPAEVRTLWGGQRIETLIEQYAMGQGSYLGDDIFAGIRSMMRGVLPSALSMLLGLLAVALLSGFLKALSDAGVEGLGDIAGFVCHCFAVSVALAGFVALCALARDTIEQMTSLIEQAFPALLTLLTAAGGLATAGIFQPAMALLSNSIALTLKNVVLPLILIGGALATLSNMTGRVQLGQLFALCKSAAKWVIGLLFTLYFAITSLQGMTAAAFDGISVRTAKYALDKMIPIVGGMVSGTVDTVLGCAVLVKNAAGMAAIFLVFGMVALPLLEITAGVFSFRIAAALSEPIADARLPKMMGALADVLSHLLAAVIVLAVMFMITVGLLMRAGTLVI